MVDDHQLVRKGLAAVVETLDGYTISMEAGNGKEFLKILTQLREPDIAIIDIHMPIMNGYETMKKLCTTHPSIPCLALTFDDSDDALIKSLQAGAKGFLLKDASPRELREALDSIRDSGVYESEESAELRSSNERLETKEERERAGLLERISPKEMVFLQHVCSKEEPTYEEIAKRMGVHRRTVDNYRVSLFSKYNIKSKAGLVLFAVKWNLVEIQ